MAYSLRVETQPSIGVRPLLILGPTRGGTAGVSKRVDRHLATGERKLPRKPVKGPEARPTLRLRSHRGRGHLVPLVGRGGAAAQQPAEPALPALGRRGGARLRRRVRSCHATHLWFAAAKDSSAYSQRGASRRRSERRRHAMTSGDDPFLYPVQTSTLGSHATAAASGVATPAAASAPAAEAAAPSASATAKPAPAERQVARPSVRHRLLELQPCEVRLVSCTLLQLLH